MKFTVDRNLNLVPIESADPRPEVNLAREFNPEIIIGQARENLQLKASNATLTARLARYEKSVPLRVAFVSWICRDAYSLMVELPNEKPFLVASAFDEPEKYASLFAKFLVAALFGGDLLDYLRTRDGGQPVLSAELERVMGEVGRG